MSAADRDREIASAIASGATAPAVATAYGLTPQRVRQIAAAAGLRGISGRPRTGAVTPRTARGQALLAQLVTDAAAAGVEPEDHLAAARGSGEE
jgi:hypothetical protein